MQTRGRGQKSRIDANVKMSLHNRVFTSENDVENGLDNQTNRAGGLGAEDCLAAAEHFAISCTDTDLAQMAEMLTGLK